MKNRLSTTRPSSVEPGKLNGRKIPGTRRAASAGQVEKRIGVAKGVFVMPDDIDISNEEVARLFQGDDASRSD